MIESNLVTNIFAGRLGNRMFQIASAYAYSLKHNKRYFINDSFYKAVNKNHFVNLRGVFPNLEKLYIDINNDKVMNFNQMIENHNIYNDFQFLEGDVLFNGYYQSEKYFSDYRREILELYDFNKEIKKRVDDRWTNILKENSASIHVRRTDYLHLNFPIVSIEYYNECIDLLKDKIDNVIVFSDDIDWCKNNIKSDIDIIYSNQIEIDDMYLMSMCKYNIIANSSFSWWGSYLNDKKDKIIYAPNKWFVGNHEKIYRDDMIII